MHYALPLLLLSVAAILLVGALEAWAHPNDPESNHDNSVPIRVRGGSPTFANPPIHVMLNKTIDGTTGEFVYTPHKGALFACRLAPEQNPIVDCRNVFLRNSERGSFERHYVRTVTGLTPNFNYQYQVTQQGIVQIDYSFRTPGPDSGTVHFEPNIHIDSTSPDSVRFSLAFIDNGTYRASVQHPNGTIDLTKQVIFESIGPFDEASATITGLESDIQYTLVASPEELGTSRDSKMQFTTRGTFTPNSPPTVSDELPTERAAEAGVQLRFDLLSTDPDIDEDLPDQLLWYSIESGPEGATMDPRYGIMRWTPDESHAGKSFNMTLRVEDSHVPPAFDTLELKVNVAALPLVIDELPDQTVNAFSTLRLNVSSSGGLEQKTYSIEPSNLGASIDADGVLTWFPTLEQVGDHTFTVSVASGNQTQSDSIGVTVGQPIVTIHNQTSDGVTNEFAFTAGAQDITAQFMRFNGTAHYLGDRVMPSAGQTGTTSADIELVPAAYYIEFWTDQPGTDASVYAWFAPTADGFEILPNPGTGPPNELPVMDAVDDITVDEGQPVQIMPGTADSDGRLLTWFLSGDELAGAEFDALTGQLDWVASESETSRQYNITLTVSDDRGGLDSENVTITVNKSNSDPAFDDTIMTQQSTIVGESFTLDATATDGDLPAQTITYELVMHNATGDPPQLDSTTGTITWRPLLIQNISMTLRASDDQTPAGADNITIIITVLPTLEPNTPPMAADFAFRVAPSGTHTVDLADEGHISDAEQDELILSVGEPAEGTVQVDGQTITYNAGADAGEDTITYTVFDGAGGMTTATITVTIKEPTIVTANDDDAVTDAGVPVTIDVLANDIIAPAMPAELAITQNASDGTTTVNASNAILYSPRAGYQGVDSFEYSVSADDANDTATVTIVVGQVANTAPAAADFAVTVAPSGTVTVDLADEGHISDGEQSAGTLTVSLNASAVQGNATVQGAVFEYQANDDAAGTEAIRYTVTDRDGLSSSATITVTITQVPVEPEPEPEPVLRAPDIDVEAIPGMLTSVQPDIGEGNTIESVTGATMGSIATGFFSQGTIGYTANAGVSGIDEVTYTASDGNETAQGMIYFYINAEGNERPTLEAIPGMQTDGTATFTAEATDIDDEQLTYIIRNAPDDATMGNTTGQFSWNSTGSEAGDYIFNVVVHDDSGGLDLQKMAITVRDPANDSPTAPAVHRSTTSDTPILVTPDIRDPEGQPTGMILAVGAERGAVREGFLGANIIAYVPREEGTDIISYTTSDGAGGATTSTVYIHTGTSAAPDLEAVGVQRTETSVALEFNASATDEDSTGLSYIMSGAPAGATLNGSTGQFSWTPAATDAGDYTFTITAYDGQGGFDTESVAVSVSESGVTNRDPNIADLDSAARQNNPRFIALETSDPDDDPTGIILATNATTGAVRQNLLQFGIITYVPQIDWNGTDTVNYVVSDGRGGASTGTIHVHVRAPGNDEPVLDPIGNRQVDIPGTLTFDAGASDNNDDPLTYAIRNAPDGATMTPDGTFSWTPTTSDAGDHTITVTVTDDAGGFATEDILVTVTDTASTNQPPTAPDGEGTTSGARTVVFVDISDPDGDDTSIIAATGAFQGLVDSELLEDSIIAYTPFPGTSGDDTITYTVSDGRGGIATGTITITISAPEQPSTPPPTNTATSVYNPATGP